MFAKPIPRHWLGSAAALIAGLAVGCSNCEKCKKPDRPVPAAKLPCATCPTTLPPVTPVPAGTATALPAAPPSPLPLTSLPPVSNERYVPPEHPPQIVVAEKPKLDTALITPIERPVDTTPFPRRSFPDITAHAEFKHSSDYTNLVGELHYIPQKNQWRLRFASIEEEDKYGGSVTLDGGIHMMKDYHDGMMVRVDGAVVDAESRDISPMYHLRNIESIGK